MSNTAQKIEAVQHTPLERELLAALQLMTSYVEYYAPIQNGPLNEAVKMARALISKATGGA